MIRLLGVTSNYFKWHASILSDPDDETHSIMNAFCFNRQVVCHSWGDEFDNTLANDCLWMVLYDGSGPDHVVLGLILDKCKKYLPYFTSNRDLLELHRIHDLKVIQNKLTKFLGKNK